MRSKLTRTQCGLCISLLLFLALPTASHAIPAFARQYQTSCATCHSDFPKLNDFGKAFKVAGGPGPKRPFPKGHLARDHPWYATDWSADEYILPEDQRQSWKV
jgi:hypothetical protein